MTVPPKPPIPSLRDTWLVFALAGFWTLISFFTSLAGALVATLILFGLATATAALGLVMHRRTCDRRHRARLARGWHWITYRYVKGYDPIDWEEFERTRKVEW